MAKADFYQVITTFQTSIDGEWVEYHRGELVDADDPALKRMPHYFGPPEFKHRRRPLVEAATAAPGEKRGA
jgi:hypothetical protein